MKGFVPNYIEEIKKRIGIVDYISARVTLKKSGKNFKGLCPFHSEKSGSFFVFPHTESYYCFGCHESGDIFRFAMKTEGLEFGEALENLAQRAGVTLPEKEQRPDQNGENESRRNEKERLKEANAAAATYFQHLLLNSKEGQIARDYLNRRGISQSAIEGFGLGYALDSFEALLKHLSANGRFTVAELVNAGLVGELEREGERENRYYDRFRGRLMFPIRDRQGQIIAFGGRVLEGAPADAPKYINSPQTALFDKSATLYGLDLARETIKRADRAVIVEGYVDVIAAHQAGFANVVAPLGTALNEKHVVVLKKLTKRIVLALDADSAGKMATLRGIEVLKQGFDTFTVATGNARGLLRFEQQLDADIRVAVLPTGKDPDEVIGQDPAHWSELIERALPVVDYTFATVSASFDLTTARGKSDAVEQLVPTILEIRDRIAREHYVQKLANLVQIQPEVIRGELRRAARQATSRTSRPENDSPDATESPETGAAPIIQIGAKREMENEEFLLAYLWRYPEGLEVAGADGLAASPDDFTRSENRELFQILVTAIQNGLSPADTAETLEPEMARLYEQLQEYNAKLPELDPFSVQVDLKSQLNRLRQQHVMERWEALNDSATEPEQEEETLFLYIDQTRAKYQLYYPSQSPVFRDTRDR